MTRRAGGFPATASGSVAIFGSLLAACSGGGPSDDGWTVARDTLANGAVHVLHTPPADDLSVPIPVVEELRIGSIDEEGPTSFAAIKGILALEDGRIAVLEAQAREIRLFGPGGEHLASYGRKGQGPGEMESPYGLMLSPGGELWVPDHQNARMNVFDPDDGFDRSFAMPVLSYGYVWSGVMSDGGRIIKPSLTMSSRTPMLRVYDPAMALVDTLMLPPRPEYDADDPEGSFAFRFGESGRGYAQVPFYQVGVVVYAPDGPAWSVPRGDPTYRVHRWLPEGDTALVLEVLRPPVPVTSEDREAAVAGVLSSLEQYGVKTLDESKIPPVKAAVSSMFLSADGDLWVRIPMDGPGATYDVFTRDGDRLGTVHAPFAPLSYLPPFVRGDRIWAVAVDELDVQYVVQGRFRSETEETPLETRRGGESAGG